MDNNNKIADAIIASSVLLGCFYMGNNAISRIMNVNNRHLRRNNEVYLDHFIVLNMGLIIFFIGLTQLYNSL